MSFVDSIERTYLFLCISICIPISTPQKCFSCILLSPLKRYIIGTRSLCKVPVHMWNGGRGMSASALSQRLPVILHLYWFLGDFVGVVCFLYSLWIDVCARFWRHCHLLRFPICLTIISNGEKHNPWNLCILSVMIDTAVKFALKGYIVIPWNNKLK